MNLNRILILSPHTDDAEFGCGALISKSKREGFEVRIVTFSICEESVPEGYEKDVLLKECKKSNSLMGVDKHYDFRYRVRYFHENRQDILEHMVSINKEYKPTLVCTPSVNDIHQDHKVICEESIRAFKKTSIIGYTLPWNLLTNNTNMFIDVDEEDVLNKVKYVNTYKSQGFRPYSSFEHITSNLRLIGSNIGKEYCEPYEIIRLII